MHFHTNVRTLRVEKDLKQKELAKKIGVAPSIISAYEKGTSSPRIENLIKLADVFDVKPGELLDKNFMDPNISTNTTTTELKDRSRQYEFLIDEIMALKSELSKAENLKEAKEQLDEIIATLKKKYPDVAKQLGL